MNRSPKSLSDQTIERLIRQAEEAWSDQDYRKSIQLIEQASRLEPGNMLLLLELAKAHGRRYDYEAAEKWIEKAVQISPKRVDALTEAGRTCLDFENVDMATHYLYRASLEKDVSIGALVTLGDIHLRDRRTEAAAEMVDRAERKDSKDARVSLLKARFLRARGAVEQAESLLRQTLSRKDAGYAVRVRGLYELADILDRSARYDEAFEALQEVKKLQLPQTRECLPAARLADKRGREMEQSIAADVLNRWRKTELAPARRIALLCGHPRSGTTLLEQVLDAHPDVLSAEETKLMHDEAYLPIIRPLPEGTSIRDALDSPSPDLLLQARENYFRSVEKLIGKKVGGRLLIDKNPALNMLIPMVVRIFPEAKLLIAIRDPRDVVLSCFMQALPITPVSCAYLDLDSAVKQYASVMNFWLTMRDRLPGQWIEVRYEDMVEDLEAVSRRVLEFMGLAYDPAVLRYYEHAQTKRINSPTHADVIKPVYKTAKGRWQAYRKHLEPHFAPLQPFLKAFGYD